jgi:hypothetical protein
MTDLRLPVGGLLGLVGLLLLGYGLAHGQDPALHPTGVAVDTIWGAVMLVVGAAFVVSARRGRKA